MGEGLIERLKELRCRLDATFAANPALANMPVPTDAELRAMQARGELGSDAEIAMTDTLIERMARALYDDSSKGQRDCLSWDEMKAIHGIEYEGVARFYRRARAALAAIRVPTERMIIAGLALGGIGVGLAWTAMVDRELKDG